LAGEEAFLGSAESTLDPALVAILSHCRIVVIAAGDVLDQLFAVIEMVIPIQGRRGYFLGILPFPSSAKGTHFISKIAILLMLGHREAWRRVGSLMQYLVVLYHFCGLGALAGILGLSSCLGSVLCLPSLDLTVWVREHLCPPDTLRDYLGGLGSLYSCVL
jgi:hypothetical protein